MSRSKVYTIPHVKEDLVIKQEVDNSKEFDLLLHETSPTSETPEEIDIKPEEKPQDTSLLEESLPEEPQVSLPSKKRHDFACKKCPKTYRSKKRYHAHIEGVHNITTSHLVPDKHDPNCYCKSCDRTYHNQRTFQTHLKYSHNILMTDLEPDKDDPLNFCRACELMYETRGKYVNHLFGMHKIRVKEPAVNPHLTPNEHDPNNYCNVCDRTYATKNTFRIHIREAHNVKTTPLSCNRIGIVNPDLVPDQFDPNFYCRSCEKKYADKTVFYNHIRTVHEMKIVPPLSTKPKTEPPPNPNDPNFYCCTCDRSYHNRNNFGNHMRKVHKLKSTAKRVFGVYCKPLANKD
ncbi:uncharacterized protein EV154DRAFT_502825 [Mucor mucedo]|uniref:uncharacterized protein n=1 Tax=Mucor mucedo TaxID=29922 RepID=UPI00222087BD|nr:uncharacterized protein EV154DRAFT_502825 [Mucor mucedo]KAI7893200.1 hypothetical protein EV154DRAFT_502825 [Mucor mucedo]